MDLNMQVCKTALWCQAINIQLFSPAAMLISKRSDGSWSKKPEIRPLFISPRPSSSHRSYESRSKCIREYREVLGPLNTEESDIEDGEKYPDGEVVPPLPREALFPGAVVKGKVSSMERYGVVVDIGSFTLALVPVKELSMEFVINMRKIAKKKLDLELTVLAVKEPKNKIYLTMIPQKSELCYRWDPPETAVYDFATTSMGSEFNKGRKFEAGVEVEGLVKRTTMEGSVVALRGGGVGFVPTEPRGTTIGTQRIIGPPPLIVGKKVKVKVVGEVGGSLTLSIDPELARKAVQVKVDHGYEWDICIHDVLERPPNPFEHAFYRHKEVAHFLNERRRHNPWV